MHNNLPRHMLSACQAVVLLLSSALLSDQLHFPAKRKFKYVPCLTTKQDFGKKILLKHWYLNTDDTLDRIASAKCFLKMFRIFSAVASRAKKRYHHYVSYHLCMSRVGCINAWVSIEQTIILQLPCSFCFSYRFLGNVKSIIRVHIHIYVIKMYI